MLARIKNRIKRLPSWVFWSVMSFIALIIIIFNDAFGDSEPFNIFAFFYFVILLICMVRWTFRQIRSILSLKRDKARMEMQHLKSQVNPHFFFNTLNNLYGLVEKDPQEAKALILKLSELMRYSIYEGQHEWVPLSAEVAYLQNYVALHQERYHKEVAVSFQVDIDGDDYKIMPLMLILLVENAFKHGVEKLRDGAYVSMSIVANNGTIRFECSNNYDPEEVDQQSAGIGIANLRRRLEIGYQKKFDLQIHNENNTYTAQLSLLRV